MKKLFAVAVLLVCATGAKGQTTFEPLTTLCSRTLETSSCSNVQSADGHFALSFGGTSVAVYHDGVLALTASDLKLTVTQVGTANYYDSWFRLDGTFTGGSFAVFVEEITRVTGAGRYRQTSHYTYLQEKWTDGSGTEFRSIVTLE